MEEANKPRSPIDDRPLTPEECRKLLCGESIWGDLGYQASGRMLNLPSLYHRGLGRQPRNGFIVDSLETTKQMEKIYFHFGALGL